jgi:hypothetical protein
MPYIPNRHSRKELDQIELERVAQEYEAKQASQEGLEQTAGKPDDRDWREQAQGYILNALQIPTFGYGDDIVAAGGELLGQGSYEDNLKDVKRKHERYRELESDWSPGNIISGAAGFGVGAGPFNALMKGTKVLSRAGGLIKPATSAVGKLGQGAIDLGVAGAAAGEIAASAERPGTVGQRVAGAVEDVANLPRYAGSSMTTAIEPLAPAAEAAAARTTARMGANMAMGGTAGAVAPKVAGGMFRLVRMLRDPKNKAARLIAEQMIADGATPDELIAAHQAAIKLGKPAALVDVASTGVRDVSTSSARDPGGRARATKFLEERQAGQTERVGKDISKANGGEPGTFGKTFDEINDARAAASKPLYEKAMHDKPLSSPKIVEVVGRPGGKKAMDAGLKMAQNEGIPLEELVKRDAKGNIIGYTTKALHYAKMGIDDMIDSSMRAGNKAEARQYMILKNDLLAEMDRLNPQYATARKTFAGHSANQNALELGRKAWLEHPDQIAKDMRGMSASELDHYRQGFSQQLIEVVESSPDKANAVGRIFGTTAKRNRIKATLGPEKYAELEAKLNLENQMSRTNAEVAHGSPTAQRAASDAAVSTSLDAMSPEVAGGLAKLTVTGRISDFVAEHGFRQLKYLLQGMSQKSRGEVVRMMFSSDPNEVRMAAKLIQQEYANAQRMQKIQQGVGVGAAEDEQARQAVAKGTTVAAGGAVEGAGAAGHYIAPGIF